MRTRPLLRWDAPLQGGRGLFVVAALAASSCTDSGTKAGSPGFVDDLPFLGLEEAARIGSVVDPEQGLSRIGPVDVGPDGNLYVFELLDLQIRVYDFDGKLLGRIGRKGQGPGEFATAGTFGFRGDTLWVQDARALRMTMFGLDGSVISTSRWPPLERVSPDGQRYTVWPTHFRPDGLLGGGLVTSGITGDSLVYQRYVFDRAGAVVDSLGWATWHVDRPVQAVATVGGHPLGGYPYPPSTAIRRVQGEDTLSVDRPIPTSDAVGSFTVTRVGFDGDTAFHRTYRFRPIPVSRVLTDSLIGMQVEQLESIWGAVPGLEAAVRSVTTFETWFPGVGGGSPSLYFDYPLFVGADGALWLRRARPVGEEWLILAPNGDPRGRVELKPGARLLWSSGDTVWTQEPDALDIPWLVRYTITGSG